MWKEWFLERVRGLKKERKKGGGRNPQGIVAKEGRKTVWRRSWKWMKKWEKRRGIKNEDGIDYDEGDELIRRMRIYQSAEWKKGKWKVSVYSGKGRLKWLQMRIEDWREGRKGIDKEEGGGDWKCSFLIFHWPFEWSTSERFEWRRRRSSEHSNRKKEEEEGDIEAGLGKLWGRRFEVHSIQNRWIDSIMSTDCKHSLIFSGWDMAKSEECSRNTVEVKGGQGNKMFRVLKQDCNCVEREEEDEMKWGAFYSLEKSGRWKERKEREKPSIRRVFNRESCNGIEIKKGLFIMEWTPSSKDLLPSSYSSFSSFSSLPRKL